MRFTVLICSLWLAIVGCKRSDSKGPSDQFLSLMIVGKSHLERGDPTNAIATYRKAQGILPTDPDLRLNLAISHLAAGMAEEAIREADELLKLEPNSAAAYFIKGSAWVRLSKSEEAVKALENSIKLDPGEKASFFQLGIGRMGLQQWDAAISAFREGLRMDPNRLHAGPRYLLAQSLIRAGRQEEAQRELAQHQIDLGGGAPTISAATFERSKFTQARVPFKLDQPDKEGIEMRFVDATRQALGPLAQSASGPLAVIDPNRSGWNSLFARSGDTFRVLWNSNGVFVPHDVGYAATGGATYSKMLVGDLDNDRFEDVVVLGANESHVFKFATNGLATAVSNQISSLRATDGLLMDLDFTGKLDLIAVTPTNAVRVFRQFGPLQFDDITSTSGIPASLRNPHVLTMEDWNRDGIMDVIVSRKEGPAWLLEKQRGGPLLPREGTNWVSGSVFCAGDFDNDLRPDVAIVSGGKITICYNGGERKEVASTGHARQLLAVDYDNDGWLDLWAAGDGIQAWRNRGLAGFVEQTAQLGLDKLKGAVSEIHFADFDRDCDSDVVLALAQGGLRILRNEGGSANSQFRVQLHGTRSNASGIGCKVEVETGRLRLTRTVHRLPVEIGVGKHQTLDSFVVHWFNWPQGSAEVPFNCKEPLFALELTIQEGSCPYLYAWDGTRFRFITDILGAAPLGLPVAEGRYIDSDPEEYVWIGDERAFPAKDGAHLLQVTEELREVLYLDEAKLVVVDHEPGTEVHGTDKLLPRKPFAPGTLMTLHNEHPLQSARTLDGTDVTSALKAVDGQRVSPAKLRVPQLRGLAEPHGLILDFGVMDSSKPLVLVLNGWLRFGGGMANIAASHDPSMPFPFPALEAELAPGNWQRIDVTVGAPAGKTKTILADLAGKIPGAARRLRLTQAFEIHWDRIALLEKKADARTTVTSVTPTEADLHFRGFSAMQNLPPDWPLTPDYDRASADWYWTITPGGWCTRYGDVSELIARRDEGLAILNGGDELTLKFATNSLPSKPAGTVRQFFLYVDGWDKDSDFHVATGTQVEPLPFHGMNDQLYGREKRPSFPSDALHKKYNTRWVEGRVLKQSARRQTSR